MSSSKAPAIHIPSLEKAITNEEKRQLAAIKPQQVLSQEDSGIHAHKLTDANNQAHVTDKIYMMPESYNALRRELHDYWPNLWAQVAYNMAFKAEDFMATMNDALDLKLQVDGNKVDAICQTYLDALRVLRGVSKLH